METRRSAGALGVQLVSSGSVNIACTRSPSLEKTLRRNAPWSLSTSTITRPVSPTPIAAATGPRSQNGSIRLSFQSAAAAIPPPAAAGASLSVAAQSSAIASTAVRSPSPPRASPCGAQCSAVIAPAPAPLQTGLQTPRWQTRPLLGHSASLVQVGSSVRDGCAPACVTAAGRTSSRSFSPQRWRAAQVTVPSASTVPSNGDGARLAWDGESEELLSAWTAFALARERLVQAQNKTARKRRSTSPGASAVAHAQSPRASAQYQVPTPPNCTSAAEVLLGSSTMVPTAGAAANTTTTCTRGATITRGTMGTRSATTIGATFQSPRDLLATAPAVAQRLSKAQPPARAAPFKADARPLCRSMQECHTLPTSAQPPSDARSVAQFRPSMPFLWNVGLNQNLQTDLSGPSGCDTSFFPQQPPPLAADGPFLPLSQMVAKMLDHEPGVQPASMPLLPPPPLFTNTPAWEPKSTGRSPRDGVELPHASSRKLGSAASGVRFQDPPNPSDCDGAVEQEAQHHSTVPAGGPMASGPGSLAGLGGQGAATSPRDAATPPQSPRAKALQVKCAKMSL